MQLDFNLMNNRFYFYLFRRFVQLVLFQALVRIIMYPKWMKILLLYFDLWGFNTQFKKFPKHFDRLIFIVHLILITMATFVIWIFLTRPVDDKLGSVNDSLKLFAILLVYWLSILELNFKQQIQRKFWKIAQNIDWQFCSRCRLSFRPYILKMVFYSLVFILLYQNYFVRLITLNKSGLYWFWFCYTFIYLFRTNQILCYLFYLEFINNQLKMIDYEISEILCVYKSGNMKNTKFILEQFHRNRFKWFRKFHNSIYDLCDIVNSLFGWSNVAAIIISFHLILADTNWFYWKIFNKFRIDVIGNSFEIDIKH